MKAWGILAAIAAVGVLAGFSAGSKANPPLYTLAGTRSCLMAPPHAISGLPPASPVGRPAVFVYKLSRRSMDSFVLGRTRPHTQLGAWDGSDEGVIFSFFTRVADARASYRALAQLGGGLLIRNVVATWDGSKPSRHIRRNLLGCLRSGSPSPSPTPHPVPAASLSTFVGRWGGHARGFSISKSGVGQEGANDGCCSRIYDLSLQVTSVSGTLTRATAVYSVTAFTNHDSGDGLTIKVGDVGELLLRNGILIDTLTRHLANFCGEIAWGASRTGGCGA